MTPDVGMPSGKTLRSNKHPTLAPGASSAGRRFAASSAGVIFDFDSVIADSEVRLDPRRNLAKTAMDE